MLQICSRYALKLKRPTYAKYLLRHYSVGGPAEQIGPPRILFCGTDTFSLASLEKLRSAKETEADLFESLHIVTREPTPSGRGLKIKKVPVHQYAEDNNLSFQTVGGKRGAMAEFKLPYYGFDLVIAVSFGLFIPPHLLKSIPHSINVHPSLLPQYRGAAPIHHAILNGDRHTGVSLQTISPIGFDRGIIFEQSFAIPIEETDKLQDLWARLANIGADLLLESIRKRSYINPQPTHTFTEESPAPKIRKEVVWPDFPADRLERLDRIIAPATGAIDLRTGTRTLIQIRGISQRKQQAGKKRPGDYFLARDPVSGKMRMVVVCAEGKTVFVDQVQVAGKRWIEGTEFVESSPDRFWKSRFVPWRPEYDDHDPNSYRYLNVSPFPGETNSTESIETTGPIEGNIDCANRE